MSFFFNKPLYQAKSGTGILGIGIQSGTSQDGLDMVLCRFEFSPVEPVRPVIKLLEGTTIPFPEKLQKKLKLHSFEKKADLEEVLILGQNLAAFTAESLLDKLSEWYIAREEVCFIASHGQTLYHNRVSIPHPMVCTYQSTDSDLLSELTGMAVVSDFRARHIAAGGEGAPLAPLFDHAYFRDDSKTRVLLNIGGIANITIVQPEHELHEIVYGDTGPGNKIMDQLASEIKDGMKYDEGGKIAASGKVDEHLLEILADNPYFKRPFPKSTGPELFNLNWVMRVLTKAGLDQPSSKDLMATLAALSAKTISDCIRKHVPSGEKAEIIVSGGGVRNHHLINLLKKELRYPVYNIDEKGGSADHKEAQLFAYLGFCTLFTTGLPIFAPDKLIRLGKISLPSDISKPAAF